MKYRFLGKSGLRLSELSFGSWVTFSNQVDLKLAKKMMSYCYEQGVNFFDNAEVYAHGESERLMGKVLEELNFSRDSYCVSTKVFWGGQLPTQRGLSRKHIVDCCHGALKRLKVDYLDLYFCHRPDFYTPMEETVRAMSDLITQGKVLYWGTSEWSATMIMEAHKVASEKNLIAPVMEQPQYNLLHRERVESEYDRLYKTVGLGTTIWSPLASGILTGKYEKGIPENSRLARNDMSWLKETLLTPEGQRKIQVASKLKDITKELGCSLPELSLAWCLKNSHVTTIILGASRMEQLEENFRSLQVVEKLDHHIVSKIEAITENKPQQPLDYLMN